MSLGERDGATEIIERAVPLAFPLPGQSVIVPGKSIARGQFDRPAAISNRLVQRALAITRAAAIGPDDSIVRVNLDRLAEVGDASSKVALIAPR